MSHADYEALHAEIAAARADLARGVAALVERTDVRANLRRRVDHLWHRVLPWRHDASGRPAIAGEALSQPAIAGTVVGLLVVVTAWRLAQRR